MLGTWKRERELAGQPQPQCGNQDLEGKDTSRRERGPQGQECSKEEIKASKQGHLKKEVMFLGQRHGEKELASQGQRDFEVRTMPLKSGAPRAGSGPQRMEALRGGNQGLKGWKHLEEGIKTLWAIALRGGS